MTKPNSDFGSLMFAQMKNIEKQRRDGFMEVRSLRVQGSRIGKNIHQDGFGTAGHHHVYITNVAGRQKRRGHDKTRATDEQNSSWRFAESLLKEGAAHPIQAFARALAVAIQKTFTNPASLALAKLHPVKCATHSQPIIRHTQSHST